MYKILVHSTHGNCIAFFTMHDKPLLIAFFSHCAPHRPADLIFGNFLHVIIFIDYYRIINIILLIKFAPVTAGIQPQLSHFYADTL